MAFVALIADNIVLAALIATSTVLLFHLSKAEKNVKPQTMTLVSVSHGAIICNFSNGVLFFITVIGDT